MRTEPILIGTRGSRLALAQASMVRAAFHTQGRATRVVVVETEGDRREPDTAWGEGAFVAAIERALVLGRVDAAVHSAKDMPVEERADLRIAAYLPRADARDALVVRGDAGHTTLDDLPAGSRIGTDSPRRTGFVLGRRTDLVVHPLHGNVDTRLARLDRGDTDALVLACAGLERIGRADRITQRLPPEVIPPAPGQGAVAVQIRADDARMVALAAAIDDTPTRLAVETERAFLAASGGGCRAPIGALAELEGDRLTLIGGHATVDGTRIAITRRNGSLDAGPQMAHSAASELGSRVARTPGMQRRARVLVARAAEQADALVAALAQAGLEPVLVPTIAVEHEPAGGPLDLAIGRLASYAWVVVTSPNGARASLHAADRVAASLGGPRWAAVGAATRGILEGAGVRVDHQPLDASSAGVAGELPVRPGERVLLVRGDLADGVLAAALRARGAETDEVVAYRTREAPATSVEPLRAALEGEPIDAVVFTSGSTVRGLLALGRSAMLDVASIPCICIGPRTADEARRARFPVLAVSAAPDPATLTATIVRALAPPTAEPPVEPP